MTPPFEQTLITLKAPSAGGFREEVENVKIWFLSHNFMTNVGGATNTRNKMNICIKYGFDILIISGSYGRHRQHTNI